MLAKKYDPNKHIVLNWFMSEKLDGVRAVFDGHDFYTRNGNRLDAPFRMTGPTSALPIQPGWQLDGELFFERGRFNECSGIVRRHGDQWFGIRYLIFDVIGWGVPFYERQNWLQHRIPKNHPCCVALDQQEVKSLSQMNDYFAEIIAVGGEGIMLKNPASFYQHKRSADLLKVKTTQRENFRCVGIKPGNGKYVGMIGALIVNTYNGTTTDVGTGLSDADRSKDPLEFIGQLIDVSFFEVNQTKAEAGKLRFPAYEGIRTDI